MLEKSPADRPQTADEVLRGLEDVPITPMQGLTAGAPVPPMPSGGRASSASRRSLLYVVVAILLVIGGYIGYPRLRSSSAARGAAGASSDAKTQTASSIAVMPFINESSDRDNAYFADGLTDELIKTLGELQGLTVIGRSSVFALRDKGLDARRIGDTLGVTHILEASVQRAGARLRVTVHLVRTRDGAAIWSERYDGDVRDVFAVQDSIAQTVASSLRPKLATADSAPRLARETSSSEAYDLYLRGLELFNARTDLSRSAQYFTEALAKDPNFAEARGGLALAFQLIADQAAEKGTSGRDALDLFERAKVEAEGAIQLREATAEAHAALAMYHLVAQRDFVTSERHFLRAIQIRPGYATAHDWYALHLAFRGRMAEARREYSLARQLDPLQAILVLHDWLIAKLERQYDSAVTISAQLLPGDHTDSVHVYEGLAVVHSLQGRHTEALADARRAIAVMGADTVDRSTYATVLARAGRRTESRQIAAAMQTPAAQEKILGWDLAVLALALGDTAEALARLERFFERRYQLWFLQVGVTPEFEALHSNPRFVALLRRLGLTPTR